MSDEKITEKPPIPKTVEQPKEPSAPKTSQSAFDKVMEQQKIIQQSPTLQGKVTDQGAGEQKVKEITKWHEGTEDRKKRDDKDDSGAGKDKLKQKEKGSITVTQGAVVRGGEKRQMGSGAGGGGGRDTGGFGGNQAKRQIAEKKLQEVRGMISNLSQSQFGAKLSQAMSAKMTLQPQQMQALVNQIVQSIHVGKNELGWPELKLILKDSVFSGLRLRFTSNRGKVSIQFDTADKKVKDLFTAEAGKIKAALEKRGVVVQEIKVS